MCKYVRILHSNVLDMNISFLKAVSINNFTRTHTLFILPPSAISSHPAVSCHTLIAVCACAVNHNSLLSLPLWQLLTIEDEIFEMYHICIYKFIHYCCGICVRCLFFHQLVCVCNFLFMSLDVHMCAWYAHLPCICT